MVLLGLASAPVGAAGVSPTPVPTHETITFVDPSRPTEDPTADRSAPDRTLVTEVYVPGGKGPFPIVLLAHGIAGNPGKLSQLLEAWAGLRGRGPGVPTHQRPERQAVGRRRLPQPAR